MQTKLFPLTAVGLAVVGAGLLIAHDLGAQTSDFSNATLNDRYGFSVIAHRVQGPDRLQFPGSTEC